MSATSAGEPRRAAPRSPQHKERGRSFETTLVASGYGSLAAAGGMAGLALTALRMIITPPYPWWREAIVESSKMIRRCLIPLAICLAAFTIGFGFFVLGGITKIIGASDREGGAFIIGMIRECCVWTTGMVFAGVAGSAMTADLGSRKVREELDALEVLGVDKVRALVVPKVVASAFTAPFLGLMSGLFVELVNFTLAPSQFGFSTGVLFAATKGSLIALDVYGALIRYFIIGILVAVVSCYKGLNCDAGTQGVGKAVNQTIVIAFFSVWMLDAMFNLAYLSFFPQTQVDFKG